MAKNRLFRLNKGNKLKIIDFVYLVFGMKPKNINFIGFNNNPKFNF